MKFDVTVRVELDEFPDKEEVGKRNCGEFLNTVLDPEKLDFNLIEEYSVLEPPYIRDIEVAEKLDFED